MHHVLLKTSACKRKKIRNFFSFEKSVITAILQEKDIA